ncbi:hypothetical protein UPYG_G00230540 [Umbra pygmaea]|uniref:Uncharacterized protein n=1 Tax=Umbra pygmaea TaxID=75934 RepID=A0ABD0WI74_UMBPY
MQPGPSAALSLLQAPAQPASDGFISLPLPLEFRDAGVFWVPLCAGVFRALICAGAFWAPFGAGVCLAVTDTPSCRPGVAAWPTKTSSGTSTWIVY